MYERIIFTDDGSPLARAAVPRAAAIARANDSKVLVVRVSRAAGVAADELDYYAWDHYFTAEARAEAKANPQEAEPHLSDVVADLEARGVQHVGSVVIRGDAADALKAAADELEANLLVMSSRGTGGLKRAVLGSVAEHLIRNARETPILLCPPPIEEDPGATSVTEVRLNTGAETGIARVMLTLDGSELSQQAVPHAQHLAASLGVPLILLRATESEGDLMHATMPAGMPASATITLEDAQRMAQDQRAAAEVQLDALAVELHDHGVQDVSVEVATGDPATAILAAAEQFQVDVIIMATRGRGGIGRFILGSVADAVARRSEGSAILLVRPDDD